MIKALLPLLNDPMKEWFVLAERIAMNINKLDRVKEMETIMSSKFYMDQFNHIVEYSCFALLLSF